MKRTITFLLALILLSILTPQKNLGQSQNGAYLAAAEVMPSPIGGLKGIYKKIEYPEIAKKSGIEGKVFVIAYVNENGGVDDVKVLKGIGGGCDEAAVRAVKATKFTPGKAKGTNVKVKVALPIIFKLK